MSEQMPSIVTITRIVDETPSIRTIFFDKAFDRRPGQFVMVWVPGVDEIPMALSYPDAITVQKIGDATGELFRKNPGEKIGIRGPFGNGFNLSGKVLAIAGGVGAAPLLSVALLDRETVFLQGARTGEEILYRNVLPHACNLHVATDDGSAGLHGFVVNLIDDLDLEKFDTICVCGPEPMMVAVLKKLADHRVLRKSQFSLHRYMKCGVGICGSCCLDPYGLCVCKDGPVFTGDLLTGSELGLYHRGPSGRKI